MGKGRTGVDNHNVEKKKSTLHSSRNLILCAELDISLYQQVSVIKTVS